MDVILTNVLSELNILNLPDSPPPILEPLIKNNTDINHKPTQVDILKVNKIYFQIQMHKLR